ncbi:MAG: hypothetical protein SGPRY_011023 [Prymnesium sp.]
MKAFTTHQLERHAPRAHLDELTKLDRLDSETPAAISAIWEAYHSDRPAVAAAVPPLEEFDRILARAAESPLFVFPIRREGGHFMLFSQYSPADRMFVLTYLEEYQRSPQAAQPWASVLLFDDLVATKGIPLLRSEVAEDKLTKKEAEHLILLYRRYYGNERSGYDKVWIFNHSERHFDLGAYLATCP